LKQIPQQNERKNIGEGVIKDIKDIKGKAQDILSDNTLKIDYCNKSPQVFKFADSCCRKIFEIVST